MPLVSQPGDFVARNNYNVFPLDYFRSDLERGWVVAALLATVWGLRRNERVVWVTMGWAAVTFALLNVGPGTWVVNNNSWAITLFVPAALVIGWGADEWLLRAHTLMRAGSRWLHRRLGLTMLAGFAALAAYAGWRGLYGQVSVSNPATVLASAEDALALGWVEGHTPPTSLFLVNSWEWLPSAWSGSDGGVWLWPLTGRRTTTPPLDYLENAEWRGQVNAFNERVAGIREAGSPETLALLRAAGVTHVFIGAKGGNLKPEMFVDDPHYRLLYTNGAAWVFERRSP
jgi:hypothetical protein